MLVDLQDRLELQEQRQQQMIGFLAAALQNPGLVQVRIGGTSSGLGPVLQGSCGCKPLMAHCARNLCICSKLWWHAAQHHSICLSFSAAAPGGLHAHDQAHRRRQE